MADRSLTVRLRAEVDQFRRDMQQAAGAVADVAAAAEKAGVQRRAMQQLGQAGREVGRTLAGIGTVAVTGMAALGVQTLRTGVAYNSLEQNTRAALATLMGGTAAAEQQMDRLRAFVENRMLPREAFIQGQRQLLAFGLAAERVIPTLGAVEDAVLAVGGNATVMGEVVNVLARMQGTGRITAQELNELGNRGINAAELIGSAMGKTEAEIRDSISRGALDGREALDLLVEAMDTRFAGAAERMANTWEGATGLVSAGLRNLGSTAVEAFIDPRGGGAAVVWAQALAENLYALNRALRPLVDELRIRAEPTFQVIAERMQTVADRIDQMDLVSLVTQVSGAGPAFAALAAGIAAAGSASVLSAVGLGGLAATISPLGAAIVAAAVASPELRAALVDLAAALAPLLPALAETAVVLGTALTTGLGVVAQLLRAVLPLVETVVGAFSAMPPILQQATLAVIAFGLALRFAGPLGVALSAIAALGIALEGLRAAFGTTAASTREWRATIDETVVDLERLGRTGQVTGDLLQIGGVFADLSTALAGASDSLNWFESEARGTAALLDWLPREAVAPVGRAFLEFGDDLQTTSGAMAEAREQLSTVDRGLANMVSSGNVEAAESAFEQLALRAAWYGISQEELIELLPEYARQQERAADAARDGATAQDGFASATEAATEALRRHHDALREQLDPLFALHQALGRAEDAQDAYTDAVNRYGAESPEAEEAALALYRALLDVEGASLDASGAMDDDLIGSVRATMEAMGASEPAIQAVEDRLRDVADAGESIEDEYRTRVALDGDRQALGGISELRQELDRFANRTYTANVMLNYGSRGEIPPGFGPRVPGRQHGGPIDWGSVGIDRVPAWLTRGEHVWTVREVQAAGGHANVEALRAAVLAGSTRFAVGGPVGLPRPRSGAQIGPPRTGWTVENLHVQAWSQRFDLRQIEAELAMHGAA